MYRLPHNTWKRSSDGINLCICGDGQYEAGYIFNYYVHSMIEDQGLLVKLFRETRDNCHSNL